WAGQRARLDGRTRGAAGARCRHSRVARAGRSAVTVLLGALLLDWAFGEPSSRWHPVAGIGRLIAAGRAAARWRAPGPLLVQGAVVVIGVGGIAVLLALLAERVLIALPPV